MVIFTNRGGTKLDKPGSKLNTFKLKTAAIYSTLDIPLTLYATTENDKYRKTRGGMRNEMVDDYDIDICGVNKEESLLVGDAMERDGGFPASDRYDLILLKFLSMPAAIADLLYWLIIKILCIQCWDQIPYTRGILSEYQSKSVKDVFNPIGVAAPTVPASAVPTSK